MTFHNQKGGKKKKNSWKMVQIWDKGQHLPERGARAVKQPAASSRSEYGCTHPSGQTSSQPAFALVLQDCSSGVETTQPHSPENSHHFPLLFHRAIPWLKSRLVLFSRKQNTVVFITKRYFGGMKYLVTSRRFFFNKSSSCTDLPSEE